MKISKVKISNILGVTEVEFTPGGFNEISGPNGSGKTSILEAIKSVIEGGHDATLLRKGETTGRVVLELDDGTELTKRVTEGKSQTDVLQNGAKVGRPGDFIKALTDLISVNPVDFLRAPKKDRVRVLLETMPIVIDAAELTKISGVPVKADDTNGLQIIEAVRKQVYDDRTGTNRAVKEKDATINQLRLALPDAPAGVSGSEDELTAAIAEADASKAAEFDRVQKKLEGIRIASQERVDAIRTELQEAIDKLKADAIAKVDAEKAALAEIEAKAQTQKDITSQKHADIVTPIRDALNIIKANRDAVAKREQTLETIKMLEGELDSLTTDAERQTKALADIEAYKSKLLSELPISGVEVRDGEIYRDGIVFDRLNTAQQVWIAVEIAKLRSGDLGVCCCDGLESLDPKAFAAFRDGALESGLQLFVTRVSDKGFAINTSAASEE